MAERQEIAALFALDPEFVSDDLVNAFQQSGLQTNDTRKRVLDDVQAVLRVRARQIAHLLSEQELQRELLAQQAKSSQQQTEVSQQKAQSSSAELIGVNKSVATLRSTYKQTHQQKTELSERAKTSEAETSQKLQELESASKTIAADIVRTNADVTVAGQHIQETSQEIDKLHPPLLAKLEQMQLDHDREIVMFQAKTSGQLQFKSFDIVNTLFKIKDSCEQRIRTCADETKTKLDAMRQGIELRKEQLSLLQEERQLEEEDIALTEEELAQKDQLIADTKTQMQNQLAEMCQPLNTMRESLLQELEQVKALVVQSQQIDKIVQDMQDRVENQLTLLMEAEDELEQLKQDLAQALDNEKQNLENAITAKIQELEDTKVQIQRNEKSLAEFRLQRLSLALSLQEKEAELEALLSTATQTEQATIKRSAQAGELEVQKKSLKDTLAQQVSEFELANQSREEMVASIAAQRRQLAEMQHSVDQEQNFVDETLAETLRSLTELSASEISEQFTREHQASLLQVRSFEDAVKAKTKQQGALQEEWSALLVQIKQLEAEVSPLLAPLDELDSKIAAQSTILEKNISDTVSKEKAASLDPNRFDDPAMKKMVQSLDKRETDVVLSKQVLDKHQEQLAQSREQVSKLTRDVNLLDSRIAREREAIGETMQQLQPIQDELATASEERANLKNSRSEAEQQHSTSREGLTKSEQDLGDAATESGLQKQSVDVWQQRLETVEAELAAKLDELTKQRDRQVSLAAEVSSLESQIADAQSKFENQKQTFGETRNKLRDRQEEVNKLAEAVA